MERSNNFGHLAIPNKMLVALVSCLNRVVDLWDLMNLQICNNPYDCHLKYCCNFVKGLNLLTFSTVHQRNNLEISIRKISEGTHHHNH